MNKFGPHFIWGIDLFFICLLFICPFAQNGEAHNLSSEKSPGGLNYMSHAQLIG